MVYKKLFWLLLLTGTMFVIWQKWGQSLAFIFFASRKSLTTKAAQPASRPFTTNGRPIPTRVHKGSPSTVQAKSRRIVTKAHSK
jgi:hypothetical protein